MNCFTFFMCLLDHLANSSICSHETSVEVAQHGACLVNLSVGSPVSTMAPPLNANSDECEAMSATLWFVSLAREISCCSELR